jgi:hypothetical protein
MRNDDDTGMAMRGSAHDMDVGLGQTLTGKDDDDSWARDSSGELSKSRSRRARKAFLAAILRFGLSSLCCFQCSV